MEIAGKPIIHHVIDACRDFDTVVAIPKGDKDLKECIGSKCQVREGDEEDVSFRFAQVICEMRPRSFIRVCADSPMLRREVVKAVGNYSPDHRIVRSVGSHGQLVERIDSITFLFWCPHFNEEQREHVTSFFYDSAVPTVNIKVDEPSSAVDTQADFDRVKAMMEA